MVDYVLVGDGVRGDDGDGDVIARELVEGRCSFSTPPRPRIALAALSAAMYGFKPSRSQANRGNSGEVGPADTGALPLYTQSRNGKGESLIGR